MNYWLVISQFAFCGISSLLYGVIDRVLELESMKQSSISIKLNPFFGLDYSGF